MRILKEPTASAKAAQNYPLNHVMNHLFDNKSMSTTAKYSNTDACDMHIQIVGEIDPANVEEIWDDLIAGLSTTSIPKRALLRKGSKGQKWKRSSALLWGMHANDISVAVRKFVEQLSSAKQIEKASKKSAFLSKLAEATTWSTTDETAEHSDTSFEQAISILAINRAFPDLIKAVPDSTAKELFAMLIRSARYQYGDPFDSKALNDSIVQQLLQGELPLTLAVMFPHVEVFQAEVALAIARLRHGQRELLDTNGFPKTSILKRVRIVTSCWIRSQAICDHLDTDQAVSCYEGTFVSLATQLLRLMRHDGSSMLNDDTLLSSDKHLFRTIANLVDEPSIHDLISIYFPQDKHDKQKQLKKKKGKLLPDAAECSEQNEIAVLKSGWTNKSPTLIVDFSSDQPKLELNSEQTVLSGTWEINVSISGKQLAPQSDWKVVCWHSDDDCDYLEIELAFEKEIRVQRQILLGRDEHFLFLADAILNETNQEIHYQSVLPVTRTLEITQPDQTCEFYIEGERRLAAVLPISLPEWKNAFSNGAVTQTPASLVAKTTASASTYFPLFIDLDSERIQRSLTWRQLTVACKLQIESPDQAVGYRVQVDDWQWLFYRSLTEPKSRTLLGQNLFCEFFAGEFDLDGDVTEILTIK